MSETHAAINQIRDLRRQLTEWQGRIDRRSDAEAAAGAVKSLQERLAVIEEELIQVKALSFEDTLAFPIKLNNKLVSLAGIVAQGDRAPTHQAREVYDLLASQTEAQLGQLRETIDRQLPELNGHLQTVGLLGIHAS